MVLRFELPTLEMKTQAIEFINEFHKYDSAINGTGGLDIDDYEAWLKRTIDAHSGVNIRKNRVPASTYFVFNQENVLVGMVNIRHELSEYLIASGSGHIGYSIRPTHRRVGYATELLRKALEILRKDFKVTEALLGCYKDNIGSMKTILNNGGVFDREIVDEENKTTYAYTIKWKG